MPDNNLAIILTLGLIGLAVAVAGYYARRWIKSFSQAMLQAKTAQEQGGSEEV